MTSPEETEFRTIARTLAPVLHERWRTTSPGSPNDRPFEALPQETQQANLASAERIPRVLAVIQLRLVPARDRPAEELAAARQLIDANLERLAEAEHEGWMAEKHLSGWVYGPTRDDIAKHHPSIVPYSQLSEAEKEKDRRVVRAYADLVSECGFSIAPHPE